MHLALVGLTIHAHTRGFKVVDEKFVLDYLKSKGEIDPSLFKAKYLYSA